MSTDLTQPRTRRAVLAASAGALGALVARSIITPEPSRAADGDNLVIGQSNTGSTSTGLSGGVADASRGMLEVAATTGAAVVATSTSGTGVAATSSTGTGVVAQTSTGTIASSAFVGSGTPPTPKPITAAVPAATYGEANGTDGTGVWGFSSNATGTGVYGEGSTGVWGFGGWGVFGASDATGTGVYGFSGATVPGAPAHTGVFGYSDSGYGVYARAATGTALYVNGKAGFSRSGKVAITAGHSSVAKSLAGVTTSSLIIAVLQTAKGGYYLVAAVPAAGKFTVYLNKAAVSTMYVAYFVVN